MFLELNSNTDITPLRSNNICDKYDYLAAVACGMISGLVDVFLVGSPADSTLVKWTDQQVDKCVMQFAKTTGWSPRAGKENSVASAIGWLEKKYKVNYDQRHSGDINGLFNMSTKNHHMKSLAHSPDPLGLFFSVLSQFTNTSPFLNNGSLIFTKTETFELIGTNPISKLFCGIANWFGHLMSDVAGSSGSRGEVGRGGGLPMPFYELFGMMNFGEIGQYHQTFATLATKAFESGYDLRFGATMAIPVILCETTIRFIWLIRQHFQYRKPLKDCIPSESNDGLRAMLLIGHGSLCLVDGADALIRSHGDPLAFFLRLNLVGWCRLAKLAIKEICIRLKISYGIENMLDALKTINIALSYYLSELEKIDFEAFRREKEISEKIALLMDKADNEEQLNQYLLQATEIMGIELCWKGKYDSFDSFMKDKNARMVFE